MVDVGGRPLKFKDVGELQKKIDAYFDKCDEGETIEVYDKKAQEVVTIKRPIPYTITGLAMALGTYRQTLINYEHKDGYVDTIKTAKARCENWVELKLLHGDSAPAGPIFALKNFGWKDKQELEVNDITARTDAELQAELNELLRSTESGDDTEGA